MYRLPVPICIQMCVWVKNREVILAADASIIRMSLWSIEQRVTMFRKKINIDNIWVASIHISVNDCNTMIKRVTLIRYMWTFCLLKGTSMWMWPCSVRPLRAVYMIAHTWPTTLLMEILGEQFHRPRFKTRILGGKSNWPIVSGCHRWKSSGIRVSKFCLTF